MDDGAITEAESFSMKQEVKLESAELGSDRITEVQRGPAPYQR